MDIDNIRSEIRVAITHNPLLNQKVVAGMAGISQGYLSQILSDDRTGGFALIVKLAEIVGIVIIPTNEKTLTREKSAILLQLMSSLSIEFAEATSALSNSIADDKLDPQEIKTCIQEIDDIVSVSIQLKACLKGIHNET